MHVAGRALATDGVAPTVVSAMLEDKDGEEVVGDERTAVVIATIAIGTIAVPPAEIETVETASVRAVTAAEVVVVVVVIMDRRRRRHRRRCCWVAIVVPRMDRAMVVAEADERITVAIGLVVVDRIAVDLVSVGE